MRINFDRKEYNKRYYQQNKKILNQKRLRNYHQNKETKQPIPIITKTYKCYKPDS